MGKSPEMVAALDSLSQAMFGRSRSQSVEGRVCVTCGKPVGQFRDHLSEREFGISGMCQLCQNKVFGEPTE